MSSNLHTGGEISDDDVRRVLRDLRVDPAPVEVSDDAFAQSLHLKLAAVALEPAINGRWLTAARRAFSRWPLLWPASGLASGLAAFALLVALRHPAPTETTEARMAAGAAATVAEVIHRVPADKTAVIRINFAAETALPDVNFEITLPDGLSFYSRGEKLAMRSFRWQGQLTPGDNPIPIAVRGDRPGRYRVRAGAEAGGTRIEHEVVLEVEGA